MIESRRSGKILLVLEESGQLGWIRRQRLRNGSLRWLIHDEFYSPFHPSLIGATDNLRDAIDLLTR